MSCNFISNTVSEAKTKLKTDLQITLNNIATYYVLVFSFIIKFPKTAVMSTFSMNIVIYLYLFKFEMNNGKHPTNHLNINVESLK